MTASKTRPLLLLTVVVLLCQRTLCAIIVREASPHEINLYLPTNPSQPSITIDPRPCQNSIGDSECRGKSDVPAMCTGLKKLVGCGCLLRTHNLMSSNSGRTGVGATFFMLQCADAYTDRVMALVACTEYSREHDLTPAGIEHFVQQFISTCTGTLVSENAQHAESPTPQV